MKPENKKEINYYLKYLSIMNIIQTTMLAIIVLLIFAVNNNSNIFTSLLVVLGSIYCTFNYHNIYFKIIKLWEE